MKKRNRILDFKGMKDLLEKQEYYKRVGRRFQLRWKIIPEWTKL